MKNVLVLISIFLISCSGQQESPSDHTIKKEITPYAYSMVIHGGAGSASRDNMSKERETLYREKINEVLNKGESLLKDGSSALDVVEECIRMMEDSPLFNAGKGAVFTYEGVNELDASIMNGKDKSAGCVAGVTTIKNPISAARAVMEKSAHVLLSREGAEEFSKEQGLEQVDRMYFHTESKENSLKRAKEINVNPDEKHGTVGVVVLDKSGNIAAGTSTGGMTNKRWGRIGDSPIIGAGTYAENGVGGVSCTGHGEFFIRYAVAYDVIAKSKYQGLSLREAAEEIVNRELKKIDAAGGLVALDANGRPSMPFNTSGMFRGYVHEKGRFVGIFGDEER